MHASRKPVRPVARPAARSPRVDPAARRERELLETWWNWWKTARPAIAAAATATPTGSGSILRLIKAVWEIRCPVGRRLYLVEALRAVAAWPPGSTVPSAGPPADEAAEACLMAAENAALGRPDPREMTAARGRAEEVLKGLGAPDATPESVYYAGRIGSALRLIEFESLAAEFGTLAAEVGDRMAEFRTLAAEFGNLLAEVKSLVDESMSVAAEFGNLLAEVKSLVDESESVAAEIKNLVAEIENLVAEVEDLSAEIRNRVSEFGNLRTKATNLRTKAMNLRTKVMNRLADVKSLPTEIQSRSGGAPALASHGPPPTAGRVDGLPATPAHRVSVGGADAKPESKALSILCDFATMASRSHTTRAVVSAVHVGSQARRLAGDTPDEAERRAIAMLSNLAEAIARLTPPADLPSRYRAGAGTGTR